MFTETQIKQAWKLANSKGIQYFGADGHNAKSIKSDKLTNYLSYLMYLAPSNQSGRDVCPMASVGCANACLYTAGRGATKGVKQARIRRTDFWFDHRSEFKMCVFDEIQKHVAKAKRMGKTPAIRLNGTSDILFENKWPEIFEYFKGVPFYDYTKIWMRLMPNWNLPSNYYLTLSRSESNDGAVNVVLKTNPKANVAVVFEKVPNIWRGRTVINGDAHDLRILDKPGVIVGLKSKGQGWRDETGFVVRDLKTDLVWPTVKGK